jgi:hypothetical protein
MSTIRFKTMRALIDQFAPLATAAVRWRKRRRCENSCAICGRYSFIFYRCDRCRQKHRRAMRAYVHRRRPVTARQNRRRRLIYADLRSRGYSAPEARRYSTSVARAVSAPRPAPIVTDRAPSLYRLAQKLETAIKRSHRRGSLA